MNLYWCGKCDKIWWFSGSNLPIKCIKCGAPSFGTSGEKSKISLILVFLHHLIWIMIRFPLSLIFHPVRIFKKIERGLRIIFEWTFW